MEICPFVYGRALNPHEFYNRRRELQRLIGRLVTGQSTAIFGPPHIGKTSLLYYILNTESRHSIAGERLQHCIFSYIDAQILGKHIDQPAFWRQVLLPLSDQCNTGSIYNLYKTAEANQFEAFSLEALFCELGSQRRQFVLVIDEFDTLLTHLILNSPDFYGSLRSFASRCRGFTLIIASCRPLNFLNVETQKISPHGSPYFNIFSEIRMGPLPKGHSKAILGRAETYFDSRDKTFVLEFSGRHPYLLQMAATILWEINTQGRRDAHRYQDASDELHTATYSHFVDTWNTWTTAERKAITAIALAQITGIVDEHRFAWKNLVDDISDYQAELRCLEDAGIICESGKETWQITQQALLWWLADEIKRIARDASTFETWLCDQEIEFFLTKKERTQMIEAIKLASHFTTKGAMSLIERFAKKLK